MQDDSQPAPQQDTAQPASSLKKIFIVEDEVDARTLFVDLLESVHKYDVSSAVDGIDALAKAAAEKFDLILLDIVMPNKDGVDVLQEIVNDEQKYGKPVVVMLTNISGDAAVEKALEIGAAGYKLKIETEPEELLREVEDFLNGKQETAADAKTPSVVELPAQQKESSDQQEAPQMPAAA